MIRSDQSPTAVTATDTDRCRVPVDDDLFRRYHDHEWGRPTADDTRIFEKLCLEGFQSGLSWATILHKREAFRDAFDGFDIERVADYGTADIERLMQESGIVRNRRKIESAIRNAVRARALRQEHGSLGAFLWSFQPPPEERPPRVSNAWLHENPTSPSSHRLAKALKSRGWTFVGPTNLYALMQALGLVNDHVHGCPARAEVERDRSRFDRPALRGPIE